MQHDYFQKICFDIFTPPQGGSNKPPINLKSSALFFDFSLTVKAAPHDCVIRTGQPYTKVKAENEAWFYSKVTASLSQHRRKTHYLVLKTPAK